jgi:hypothetical protein
MRPALSALFVALGFAFLAGCSSGNVSPAVWADQPASVVPVWMRAFGANAVPPANIVYARAPKAGIYAAQFYGTQVLGYRTPDKNDGGPVCGINSPYVNGFSVDATGNLVVPSADPNEITIYQGPRLCGKPMGHFKDPYGQASDAASSDAVNGTIVVGNIEASATDKVGNVAVCTRAKGCTKKLKSGSIKYYGGGVALAKNGDCWITSESDPSFSHATLTYFKGCKTSDGNAAKGWKNAYYGGLMIDHFGDLVSIDFDTPALWVYKGCDPICRVVAGPFKLEGYSFYGNLSPKGNELAIGDLQYGQVDVYEYSPHKLTYEYSVNRGLSASNDVEAAGFTPSL